MNEPISNNPVLPRIPLHNPYGPISATQMFERTLTLLHENFGLFSGIVLVIIGIEVVIGGILGGSGLWVQHSGADAAPILKALFILPLSLLGGLMIFIFVQLAHGAIFIAAQARLAGVRITAGEACQRAADRIGRLIGISILVALRVFGYLLLFYFAAGIVLVVVALSLGGISKLAAGAAALRMGSPQAMGSVLILVVVALALIVVYLCFLLWLVVRYAVAVPAALAEDLPVTDAIRRSIQLTRHSKGRLCALYLVVGLIWIAFMALVLPMQFLMFHKVSLQPGFHPGMGGSLNLVVEGCKILLSAVMLAFVGIATTLCYYDLRVRKENFGDPAAPLILEVPPTPLAPIMPAAPVEDFPLP